MKQPHREEHDTLRWPPELVSQPPPRPTRSLIADRYRLMRPLGMGGTSTVFEAEDTVLDQLVAVKMLHCAVDEHSHVMERFLREVGVGAVVGHPNVVGVTDSGTTEDGTPFIVMELLEGASLAERLTRGPLSPKAAVGITQQVLGALQAAHEHGIIHRDLKPDNVFLCREGIVKVLDFGIAKLDEAMHSGVHGLSGDLVVGTPAYMSPEQASGREVDARTDVYAVGALLYEMLCGQAPYTGPPQQIMQAIVSRDPPPLAQCAPQVPLALCGIVERAMARDVARRYATAADLMEAIEPFLIAPSEVFESRPIPLVRRRISLFPSPDDTDGLPMRWHPWRWGAALVAIAATLVYVVPGWGEGIASIAERTFAPVPRARAPLVHAPAPPAKTLDLRVSVVPPEQLAVPPATAEPADLATEPRPRARHRRRRPVGFLPGVPYQPFPYEPPPPSASNP